jgi:hypothetical protein
MEKKYLQRKPMVRKALTSLKTAPGAKKKRKTTTPLGKLKKELWELCRKITEKRYESVCYTCDKPVAGANRHLGHFIPRSAGGTLLRYNLDNLRWQCYYDNINLGGNGAEYYRRLVKEVGQEKVDELFEMKKQIVKADRAWYEETIARYKALLEKE